MHPDEVFDRAAEELCLGRRIEVKDLADSPKKVLFAHLEMVRQRIDFLKSRRCPKMSRIHIYFTDAATLNASAFTYSSRNFICINYFGAFVPFHLFCRMLAEPSNFTHIGDPSAENRGLPKYDVWCRDFEQLAEKGSDLVVPQGTVRTDYARLLWLTFLDFLVLHEFSHFAEGHLAYLRNQGSLSVITEFQSGRSASSRFRDDQAMEIDADQLATIISIGFFPNVLIGGSVPGSLQAKMKNPDIHVLTWLTAIHTFFTLCEPNVFNLNGLEGRTHPPAFIRSAMVGFCLAERGVLKVRPEIDPVSLMALAQTHVDRALTSISDTPICAASMGVFGSGSPAAEYCEQLKGDLRNLRRKELDRLSFWTKATSKE
jgi:hypothetical protein